ncbi:MAG: YbaK/EbsC family protein [Acidimicrobiales bacterium]
MSALHPSALHPSARRVCDWAAAKGLELEVHEYPKDGARTAEDAANAVGCKVDQIVKSMIFSLSTDSNAANSATEEGEPAESELVLALTAGSNKIDPKALAAIANGDRCGRADPEQVRSITGYAIGGVPPFAHANRLRTWIDPHLLTFDEVWAAAGTPRHVFPIAPARLLELTGAVEAPFTAS